MAKTFDEVLREVTGIFREVLNNEAIQLKRETTAAEVPEWDSLTHVELVVAVEKHFGIRFNFVELQKFKNVGEWCDNIAGKLAAK
jgi:acyl carrier protein